MNCQEDWGLCNREGIQSYPSLVLYPGVRFAPFCLFLIMFVFLSTGQYPVGNSFP